MEVPELLFIVISLQFLFTLIEGQACGGGLTLTYVKVPNMLPRTAYPPVLLYAQAPGIAITATCYNRCRDTTGCDGFLVDYKQGACYRLNVARQHEDYQHQPTVNFFRKVCLKVPTDCAQRAWPMEYVPGYKLLAEQHTVIPNVADKWQCAQRCLDHGARRGAGGGEWRPCRSAQFQAWSRTCTLSEHDRHSAPDAFSPAVASDREFEYVENQCPAGLALSTGIEPEHSGFCWRDPIYNKTSMRSDLEIENLNLNQCEWRCQTEPSFRCFGYTFQCPVFGNVISRCLLHSDEIQSGLSPLAAMPCTTYRERISCLDVKVECSPDTMTVTLHEKNFAGQLFVRGHANECGSAAAGSDRAVLAVPLPRSDYERNQCDVQVVRSVGAQNRTVASAVVVIQHHKLIQTVSDRVVRVSCFMDGLGGVIAGPTTPVNNLTLNASIYVQDPVTVQNVIEGYSNNITYPPTAVMRVIDLGRGGAVSQTELGDELELQIFVNPGYNVSMVRAGHLIASSGSGQDSLLLLDWRGCPPDPATFPALAPLNGSALVARFRAFKFPDSNVLRFSVVLTFCASVCQPTDCGNGMTSYGKRRRRDAQLDEVMEEVPLQFEIVVKVPDAKSESDPKPQISDKVDDAGAVVEVGGGGGVPRQRADTADALCATPAAALAMAAGWVALQLLLLAGCCCALARRRRKPADRVSLAADFQPKHVTWGDSPPLGSNFPRRADVQTTSVIS